MKSSTRIVLIAALVAAPVASFAQSSEPVTRAQVQAELAQVEQAGYDRDWVHYPENIRAAEAKVAAQNATAQSQAAVAGYGGAADGASRSGTASGL
jgi:type II secretory pathway pseudopilin PulG